MSARIELGGLALKFSGSCWMLGEPRRRIIDGKPSEELRRPSYSDDLAAAVAILLGFASRRRERKPWSAAEEDMYRYLMTTGANVLGMPWAVLEAHRRPGESDASLARRAGLHQTQLTRMLAPDSDMLVSTLATALERLGGDDE